MATANYTGIEKPFIINIDDKTHLIASYLSFKEINPYYFSKFPLMAALSIYNG